MLSALGLAPEQGLKYHVSTWQLFSQLPLGGLQDQGYYLGFPGGETEAQRSR